MVSGPGSAGHGTAHHHQGGSTMRIEARSLELVAAYVEATGEARQAQSRADAARERLDYLRAWGKAGATLFASRSCPESSWRYVAVFPIEAVPAGVVAELDHLSEEGSEWIREEVGPWVDGLPIRGAYSGGPGRPFCHGPSVYRRGSRVVVTECGGLDI